MATLSNWLLFKNNNEPETFQYEIASEFLRNESQNKVFMKSWLWQSQYNCSSIFHSCDFYLANFSLLFWNLVFSYFVIVSSALFSTYLQPGFSFIFHFLWLFPVYLSLSFSFLLSFTSYSSWDLLFAFFVFLFLAYFASALPFLILFSFQFFSIFL